MATSRLCSIPSCGKPAKNAGHCWAHYTRRRRYGDPLAMKRPTPQLNPAECCTVRSCTKPHYSFGLCSAHYTRQRRHGDPLAGNTGRGVPLKWLLNRVGYAGNDCLNWPFANAEGRAVVTFEGRQRIAAKLMCLLVHGEPPSPTHETAHSCGKGHEGCITPRHLRWATRSENHMDKHLHGTMPIGERSHKHILTKAQVLEIRKRGKMPDAMAKRYGVHVGTIYAVLNRRNWKWLT